MHDSLAQVLSAMYMRAESIGKKVDGNAALAKEIEGISRSAKKAVGKLREAINVLREDSGNESLDDALCSLSNTFSQRNKLKVTTDIRCKDLLVPGEIKTEVLAIVEEALRNAQKHSCTEKTKVTLASDEHKVIVSVEDTGIGFDVNASKALSLANRRFGLIGMHERARQIGGTLDVLSAPEKGTVVRLSFELAGGRSV